jgi:hypothetical protein
MVFCLTPCIQPRVDFDSLAFVYNSPFVHTPACAYTTPLFYLHFDNSSFNLRLINDPCEFQFKEQLPTVIHQYIVPCHSSCHFNTVDFCIYQFIIKIPTAMYEEMAHLADDIPRRCSLP